MNFRLKFSDTSILLFNLPHYYVIPSLIEWRNTEKRKKSTVGVREVPTYYKGTSCNRPKIPMHSILMEIDSISLVESKRTSKNLIKGKA